MSIHHRIKHLLEETNDAFKQSGGGNIDYAGFASMALADFKSLLNKPDLTGKKLRRMIRRGEKTRKMKDPEGSWSSFIANHVAITSNQNLKRAFEFDQSENCQEKP